MIGYINGVSNMCAKYFYDFYTYSASAFDANNVGEQLFITPEQETLIFRGGSYGTIEKKLV